MPIYCYKCDQCGHEFEESLPMSECTKILVCDKCGADTRRNFMAEGAHCFEDIKTIGTLADRNTERKSSDEVDSIRKQNDKDASRKRFKGKYGGMFK